MAWYDEYIERRPGHCGGYPVLKRFNMSVRIIVEMSRQVPVFAALCEAMPACTPDELRAALAYYDEHTALIEEDIERNQKAWDGLLAMQAAGPPK